MSSHRVNSEWVQGTENAAVMMALTGLYLNADVTSPEALSAVLERRYVMKKQQCGSVCFTAECGNAQWDQGRGQGVDSRVTPTLSCNLGSLMV
jgi:hypothetical protein